MPWTAKDAKGHTKKADTPKRQSDWAKAANARLKACLADGGGQDECEASAIKVANAAVAEVEEQEIVNTEQIATTAIEMARLWVNADRDRLGALLQDKANTNRLLDGLSNDLAEAKVMKTVDGKKRPAGDFLVVEDSSKPDTWHLPVKVNGKVNRRLMGAAKAALTVGYRGNKYAGPGKAKALAKLKALYKSEGMEWTVKELAAMGEYYDVPQEEPSIMTFSAVTFADLLSAQGAARIASRIREYTTQFQGLISNVMYNDEIDDKVAAIRSLTDEFVGLISEPLEEGDEEETAELGEVDSCEFAECQGFEGVAEGAVVTGMAVGFGEAQGEDQPAYIDLVPVSPGWGNEKDNNYYDLPVLRRHPDVWEGAKMWATNHQAKDKNALNQISEVVKSPVGYTDGGVPIARAIILSTEFEEVARRRAEGGILNTLHCSILGKGTARKGIFKQDGREGKYIESFYKEGLGIDWVTKAGAGGHALALAESELGGETMEDEKLETTEVETKVEETETEDVTLAEQEKEEVHPLAEAEVMRLLAISNLPQASKDRLAGTEYADEAGVKAAVVAEVAYVKKLTGSGKPTDLGASAAVGAVRMTEADVQTAMDDHDRRHGLYVKEA